MLQDAIMGMFLTNGMNEIPIVLNNQIVAVAAKESMDTEYNWGLADKIACFKYFFGYKAVYMSSLENTNLVNFYKYIKPQIKIQFISNDNIDQTVSPFAYNKTHTKICNKELERYLEDLSRYRTEYKNAGAIVMNCNPFTRGHLHLVEVGSRLVDYLYVFVVCAGSYSRYC